MFNILDANGETISGGDPWDRSGGNGHQGRGWGSGRMEHGSGSSSNGHTG